MSVPAAVIRRLGAALEDPAPEYATVVDGQKVGQTFSAAHTVVRRADLRKLLLPHLAATPAAKGVEQRDVTLAERRELARLHTAWIAHPQRSDGWYAARSRLALRVVELADRQHVNLASIGAAMGRSKQAAHNLARIGRGEPRP